MLKSLSEFCEQFDNGLFFEAHETLETAWRVCENTEDRLFLQALIQTAAVFVHLKKKQFSPALSLSHLAIEKFNACRASTLIRHVDVEPIVHALNYNAELIAEMTLREKLDEIIWEQYLVPALGVGA